MTSKLPNIVFITCHDLGRHLGCYGRPTVNSPSLDQLAQEGVLFDNSFCTAPQCSPSRAALHTGRHAHSVGVLGLAHSPFNWRLGPDKMHAARRLREAGYDTHLFGGQHLTGNEDLGELGYNHFSPEEPAAQLAQKAQDFLATAANSDQPFYLEVGFIETHRPYDWGGVLPDESKGVRLPPYIPQSAQAIEEFAGLQGAIHSLDRAAGRLMVALERHGLAENTFLIFTTDHGLAMPRAKCTLYDPGIETALIMRWPAAGLTGGQRITDLISHVDVLPTLLEATGLPPAGDLHGRSFWPLLQGQPYEPNSEIFAEKTFHTAYEPMRGVRTRRHKLIVNFEVGPLYDIPDDIRQGPIYPLVVQQMVGARDPVELYDLQEDPGETTNLAGRPELTTVQDDLRGRLTQWMQYTDDPLLYGPVASSFYTAARGVIG